MPLLGNLLVDHFWLTLGLVQLFCSLVLPAYTLAALAAWRRAYRRQHVMPLWAGSSPLLCSASNYVVDKAPDRPPTREETRDLLLVALCPVVNYVFTVGLPIAMAFETYCVAKEFVLGRLFGTARERERWWSAPL